MKNDWEKEYLEIWVDILNKGQNHIYFYQLKPIIKNDIAFIRSLLHFRSQEILDEAIAIFKKLPEDEPITKNPVILELKVLKQKYETKTTN